MKNVKDIRLDSLYRHIATAQMSKAHGGHYKCTYESAAFLLKMLLGEIDDPLVTWAENYDVPITDDTDEDVLVSPRYLKIKTPGGWVSGFEAKAPVRKAKAQT
jgi:hypothetical protein